MYVDHPYAGWPLIVILFSVQLTIGDCFVVSSHSHGPCSWHYNGRDKHWPRIGLTWQKGWKYCKSAKVLASPTSLERPPNLWSSTSVLKPAARCAEPFLSPPFVLTILKIYSKWIFQIRSKFPKWYVSAELVCTSHKSDAPPGHRTSASIEALAGGGAVVARQ